MNVGCVKTLQFKKKITCMEKVLRYGVLVYKSDIVVYGAVPLDLMFESDFP